MHIIHITSEMTPIAKVGGLADVITGLSRKQKEMGHNVHIMLPKYRTLLFNHINFIEQPHSFSSFFDEKQYDNLMWKALFERDTEILLLEPRHPKNYFDRDSIYGFKDDVERFLYFARSCLDYLVEGGIKPDILHIHDWMAASVAILLKEEPFKTFFASTKCVLTIHNMEYQGWTGEKEVRYTGYKGDIQPLWQNDCCNLLQGAIRAADYVVTVSPTYAKEVLHEEGSKGLLEPLQEAREGDRFSGILNGLDYSYWNPVDDPFLTHHYSRDDLEGKWENKRNILEELEMDCESSRPLLIAVSRLVSQKGLALLKHLVLQAEELNMQYILLGSTYDEETRADFLALQEQYKHDRNRRVILRSEEGFAHRLYAAGDMFVVPSIFEPCGLTQMIALRYGAVPIVRATGGLKDTVFDLENGFIFEEIKKESIEEVVQRAVDLYYHNPKEWQRLLLQGMDCNYSWGKSAKSYLDLYRSLSA